MAAMRRVLLGIALPAAVVSAALLAGGMYLHARMRVQAASRLPGADHRRVDTSSAKTFDPSSLKPVTFAGQAAELPGAWPGFRGPRRDGVSEETLPLARQWPSAGPPVLWKIELGEGYAGPAILNGRVYLLDYDPPDCWQIAAGEVKDWPALVARLAGDAPAQKHLVKALPAPAREAIGRPGELDDARRAALLAGLNAVMTRADFYDAIPLAGLDLPGETNAMLTGASGEAQPRRPRENLSAGDLQRLNRIVLERILGSDVLAVSRHGDALRCLSLADGREIWRLSYPVRVKRFHGMSRTVPAVTDKVVVSLGPKCHVLCADAVTGEPRWGIDLAAEYGSEVPQWYAGQCPLIDGERVILAPGGSSLMIAVELSTGKVLWRTPNPRRWRMTHSSVVAGEIDGRRMYVYCAGKSADGGVVGVDAETGDVLWQFNDWRIETLVPSAVMLPQGRIFLAGGYGAGCMMLEVAREGERFVARELWRKPGPTFDSLQHTPVYFGGFLYYVRGDGQLMCMQPDGTVQWTSGPANRFGKGYGPLLIADGLLFVCDDDPVLTLVSAGGAGYQPLATARVLAGHESWAPMALAGGRLLVRDLTAMVCLDVSKGAAP